MCSPSVQDGGGLYITGTVMAISCKLSYQPGAAVYLSGSTVSASLHNCTFFAKSNDADAEFIYAGGATIDYGNCPPGWTPGEAGANVLVTNFTGYHSFTGCPFVCPLGTWT